MLCHCRLSGDVDSCYCFMKTPPLSGLTENKPKTYLVANHTLVLPEYIVTIEYKVPDWYDFLLLLKLNLEKEAR